MTQAKDISKILLMSEPRRRVLNAAIKCFGSKGYAATTIADIEAAAGLSVGAGGTYRHFTSKQAMLEAVVDAAVAAPDEEIAPPGPDIEAVAHEMLDYMRTDMMRIYLRDLDDFPDQRKRINDRTINGSYRVVAKRIAEQNPNIDAEAAAAVILGSLINFRVNEALVGEDANGVSRDRFIATWAAIYRGVLAPAIPGTGSTPS